VFLCLSPAPNTTTAAASTTATTSSTPAAPASTGDDCAGATTAKKPASLKAVTGFGKLDPNTLVNTAHHIAKGIGGNPTYFPNPPVDPAALDASATTLSNAVLAAMDGGKTAKAVVKKQHKLVVQDLNLLAVFVQNVSNDDPVIFAASGFNREADRKVRSATGCRAVIPFLGLRCEFRPDRCLRQKGIRCKVVFHPLCVMNGTTPGSWTTIPAASIQKAITLSGLTPATIYGFQVQALGVLGYSDWSATETIMCR